MNKIDSVVENYIKANSLNSALMITGEWGCGKTYYLKNHLKSIIEAQQLELIYISLNGIKNQSQLKKIVLSKAILGTNTNSSLLIDKVKGKFTKILGSVQKADQYLSVIDFDDLINLNDVVFCFDDLERVSKDFQIEDVLGFINTEFVEHNGCKVIIIGDESKRQLAKEEYAKAKEKLIGWTVEYKPNVRSITKLLLSNIENEFPEKDRIVRNEELILDLIQDFEFKNFRTIIFFIDCLKRILVTGIKPEESVERDIIYFTLIIAFEYKKGNLYLFRDLKKLPNFFTIRSFDHQHLYLEDYLEKEENQTDLETKLDLYKEKFDIYFSNNYTIMTENNLEYSYFESIYYFVIGGYLDEIKLKKEVELANKMRKDKTTEKEIDVISKLACFENLSNEELTNAENDVFELMTKGELDHYEFARASGLLLNLSKLELLEKNNDSLLTILRENLDKSKATTLRTNKGNPKIYSEGLFEYVKKNSEELWERIKLIDHEIRSERSSTNLKNRFETWNKEIDDVELFYLIFDNIEASKIANYILKNIDDRMFLKILLNSIQKKYGFISAREYWSKHISTLEKIKIILSQEILSQKYTKVDLYWLTRLENECKNVIINLKATKV